jgi:hypothetical protein
MSRTRRTFETYQCPRLRGPAIVEFEHYDDDYYPDPANHPDKVLWREISKLMIDCRSKVQCGVREVKPYGAWEDHWDLCPGMPHYNEAHDPELK